MRDVAAAVESAGGMLQKQQLVARGARDLDLTRAVRAGEVRRARQGWYTTLPDDDPRVRAVRVGGRLTGISAIIEAGGWVLGRHPLHVSVPDNAARLRSVRNRRVRFDPGRTHGVVLHWDVRELSERGTSVSVGLLDALFRMVLDESLETAVAALDWALHTGRIDLVDFESLLLRLPADFRDLGDWVDAACESLPESLSRTRLRLRGHRVTSQVSLDSRERIDLVVDECVGLEVDGDEFHRERFEYDRGKDLAITIARLHALRPSARMVFHRWETVEQAVEAAIATHLRRPQFGNSGHPPTTPRRIPGAARRKRRRSNKSPEFPKGEGANPPTGALGNTGDASTLLSG
jgi:hypothetical protein